MAPVRRKAARLKPACGVAVALPPQPRGLCAPTSTSDARRPRLGIGDDAGDGDAVAGEAVQADGVPEPEHADDDRHHALAVAQHLSMWHAVRGGVGKGLEFRVGVEVGVRVKARIKTWVRQLMPCAPATRSTQHCALRQEHRDLPAQLLTLPSCANIARYHNGNHNDRAIQAYTCTERPACVVSRGAGCALHTRLCSLKAAAHGGKPTKERHRVWGPAWRVRALVCLVTRKFAMFWK